MRADERQVRIGRLAENYSKRKGELCRIADELSRACQAYTGFSSQKLWDGMHVKDGRLVAPSVPELIAGQTVQSILQRAMDLRNEEELVQLLAEKQRLSAELAELADELHSLAPHLV